jgi:hypothetical protein
MIQLADKTGLIRQKGIFSPAGVFSPGFLISKLAVIVMTTAGIL